MMTWNDVLAHLTESYRLDATESHQIRLSWTFAGDGAPVIQPQSVTKVEALGREWLVTTCVVIEESAWQSRDAVAHNSQLAIGAIAIEGDSFIVRHVVPLATLDVDTLDQALAVLADEAVALRARIKRSTAVTPHAFWVD